MAIPYNYLININNISSSITSNSVINLYANDKIIFSPIVSNTYYITSNFPLSTNGISNGIINGTILPAYENNNYNIEISYFNQNVKYLWSATINVLQSTPIIQPTYDVHINYDQTNIVFVNLFVNETFILISTKPDNYKQSLSTISNISVNNDGQISGQFTVPGSYVIHLDYYTELGKSTIVFQFIIFPKLTRIGIVDYNCLVTVNSNIAVEYPSTIINVHAQDKIIIHPIPSVANSNIYYDILSTLNYITDIEYIVPYYNTLKQIKILYCDINGMVHTWDSSLNIIPYKTTPQTEYVCLINIDDTIFHIYNNKSTIDVKYNNKITFNPIPIVQNLSNNFFIVSNIPSIYINNKTITCPKITTKYDLDIIYYDSNNIKYSWRAKINIIPN